VVLLTMYISVLVIVEDPTIEYGQALRWLGRYLKGTRSKGTTCIILSLSIGLISRGSVREWESYESRTRVIPELGVESRCQTL
jgi:hypothetical protein